MTLNKGHQGRKSPMWFKITQNWPEAQSYVQSNLEFRDMFAEPRLGDPKLG